jgi:excisionase family DNA binding protein
VGRSDKSATSQADQLDRLTVPEAAQHLGISEAAVRGRIKRGKLPHERDGRRVWVLIERPGAHQSADQPRPDAENRPDLLIAELQDRVRSLEDQLGQERDANRETRHIIAALTQRIPAIESLETTGIPHIEGPATRYAAAIALMGFVLAAGLSLLTGPGFWDPLGTLIGVLLLLVLWSVPLNWVEARFGRYLVWPAAFGLCLYAVVAFPVAWVLSTFDKAKDVQSVQKTGAFMAIMYAGMLVVFALGALIAYLRTRPWWQRRFSGGRTPEYFD